MEGKTAVEWLVSEIPSIDWENSYWRNRIEVAKDMEKQQKDIDYQNGYLDCYAKLMSERLTRDI
jgi:hypothetical protein